MVAPGEFRRGTDPFRIDLTHACIGFVGPVCEVTRWSRITDEAKRFVAAEEHMDRMLHGPCEEIGSISTLAFDRFARLR